MVQIGGATTGSMSLAIAPNPVTDRAIVRYNVARGEVVKLELYNELGSMVRELVSDGSGQVVIDAGSLAAGSYTVRMRTAGGQLVERFTVTR